MANWQQERKLAPFQLAPILLKEVVHYCIKRLNSQIGVQRGEHTCPRVRLTGVKIDYDKDYRAGFGDYVEARNPAVTSNNVDDPRTDSCIALWPVGNRNGSWRLFSVRSGEIVTRSQLTVLPMTQVVISAMTGV